MRIMGPPTTTWETVHANLVRISSSELFLNDIAPAVWHAALDYGLDPVGVVGQSGHETGWGKFGRATFPWHRNTCGLKVANYKILEQWGVKSEDPLAHAQFATWRQGALAHVQHLWAYLGRTVPPGELVDPRYYLIDQSRPVTDYEHLSSRWAGAGYGDRVVQAIAQLTEVST